MLFSGSSALAEGRLVTILHVNDTHSHLDAVGPKDAHLDGTLGGLAKAATVIAARKPGAPNALFLHAGDFFQGDSYFNATFGVAELQVLTGLGLDAMTVGNHELVFGAGGLAAALGAAFPAGGAPPLLSANLLGASVPGVQASTILLVGGVKVAVFGLVTPFTGDIHLEDGLSLDGSQDPSGLALAAIAEVQAKQLRGQADVVILLSHLGVALDEVVAHNARGIDAIVGGHDHLALEHPMFVANPDGKKVPIVQAGEFYEHVGQLTLEVERRGVRFAGYELIPVDAQTPRAPAVVEVVEQAQQLVNALVADLAGERNEDLFHRPVAFALRDITHTADPRSSAQDTGLGNLVADALRHAGGTQVGLTVNGLVEDTVARGVVVGDDLFRVLSDGFDPSLFDQPQFPGLGFPLVTFELTSAQLQDAIELAFIAGGEFFPQVSGMTFTFDSAAEPFQRVKEIRIGGRALDPARTYTFTTNFGVASGLPQLGIVPSNQQVVPSYEYLAVRDWARRLVVLDYRPEGRAVDVAARAR
jgi:5'-nucleotidase